MRARSGRCSCRTRTPSSSRGASASPPSPRCGSRVYGAMSMFDHAGSPCRPSPLCGSRVKPAVNASCCATVRYSGTKCTNVQVVGPPACEGVPLAAREHCSNAQTTSASSLSQPHPDWYAMETLKSPLVCRNLPLGLCSWHRTTVASNLSKRPWLMRLSCPAQAISALRQKASHATDDVGIVDPSGGVHIANAGQYSIVAGRSPAQVR